MGRRSSHGGRRVARRAAPAVPQRGGRGTAAVRVELPVIAALRFEAARRCPWLRAAYYHGAMVRQTLTDPAVGADANIDAAGVTLDRPDAMIGGHYAVDVIPDTPVSRH